MKKIASELSFPQDLYQITIGTVDKKNPSVMYFKLGGYVSPDDKKDSYESDISKLRKETNNIIRDALSKSGIFKENYIYCMDVADTRMSQRKKSRIEMFIHVKINNDVVSKYDSFKDLANFVKDKSDPLFHDIQKAFCENHFSLYKTK